MIGEFEVLYQYEGASYMYYWIITFEPSSYALSRKSVIVFALLASSYETQL